MIKGLIHVHSTFSYDGKNTIGEIKNWAISKNLDFVILTEHDNDFDEAKFVNYLSECKKQSSENFLIIPGIEYSFGKNRHIHINVFGVNELIMTNNSLTDIPRFLTLVKNKGGLSILNHPRSIIKEMEAVNLSDLFGVELWNTKSDFLYSPDPTNYKFIKTRLSDKSMFLTSDIHKITDDKVAVIFCEQINSVHQNIITQIHEGLFYCDYNNKKIFSVYAHNKLNKFNLVFAGIHLSFYKFLRKSKRLLRLKVSPRVVKLIKLK